MSDKALLSFTLASCRILSTRLRSLVPTPIIFRRRRVKSRSSRKPRGGTKLGRIMACRSRCASHQLSFLSVLCPFRFFNLLRVGQVHPNTVFQHIEYRLPI